jgi:hypothetical protein
MRQIVALHDLYPAEPPNVPSEKRQISRIASRHPIEKPNDKGIHASSGRRAHRRKRQRHPESAEIVIRLKGGAENEQSLIVANGDQGSSQATTKRKESYFQTYDSSRAPQ